MIDLNEISRTLYEDNGRRWLLNMRSCIIRLILIRDRQKELKDNSHSNTFGAYELAKCIIEGMKKADLDAVKFLRKDYKGFNPDHPDRFEDFKWNLCPFTEIEKPDGN